MLDQFYTKNGNHETSNHIISSGCYAFLALIAFGLGIALANINIHFFIMGLEETETNQKAIALLTQLGIALCITELFCFFVPHVIPRIASWRHYLRMFGTALIVFEVVVISVTQIVLVNKTEMINQAQQARISALENSIENGNSIVRSSALAASVSGRSKYMASRREAMRSLKEAALVNRNSESLSVELMKRKEALRPSIEKILGHWGMIAYSIARSLLICLTGIMMFSCSGYLIRQCRSFSFVKPSPSGSGGNRPRGGKKNEYTDNTDTFSSVYHTDHYTDAKTVLGSLHGYPENVNKNNEVSPCNTRTPCYPCNTRTTEENLRLYKRNEKSRVGDSIQCPLCDISFVKKTYNHRFCSTAHKDDFWNLIKPERVKAKGKRIASTVRLIKKPSLKVVNK